MFFGLRMREALFLEWIINSFVVSLHLLSAQGRGAHEGPHYRLGYVYWWTMYISTLLLIGYPLHTDSEHLGRTVCGPRDFVEMSATITSVEQYTNLISCVSVSSWINFFGPWRHGFFGVDVFWRTVQLLSLHQRQTCMVVLNHSCWLVLNLPEILQKLPLPDDRPRTVREALVLEWLINTFIVSLASLAVSARLGCTRRCELYSFITSIVSRHTSPPPPHVTLFSYT